VPESLDLGQRPLGDLAGALVCCSQHVAHIAAIAHELGAAAADRPQTLVDRLGYQALERGAASAGNLGGDLVRIATLVEGREQDEVGDLGAARGVLDDASVSTSALEVGGGGVPRSSVSRSQVVGPGGQCSPGAMSPVS
jgi:hypothetical protein